MKNITEHTGMYFSQGLTGRCFTSKSNPVEFALLSAGVCMQRIQNPAKRMHDLEDNEQRRQGRSLKYSCTILHASSRYRLHPGFCYRELSKPVLHSETCEMNAAESQLADELLIKSVVFTGTAVFGDQLKQKSYGGLLIISSYSGEYFHTSS